MNLLAITAYYNPLRGDLRRINYQTFRDHLGVPLMTVEWSRNGDFELDKNDADYLVRVSGGDLLWQKERLLNIGIEKALAMGIKNVAFLDADIVFENPYWHELVSKSLVTNDFIQCFQAADLLLPHEYQNLSRQALGALPAEHSVQSLFSSLVEGKTLFHNAEKNIWYDAAVKVRGNPGLATAISLQRRPGWRHYEGCIVGGGDLATIAAVCQKTDEFFGIRGHTPKHQQHLRNWANSEDVAGIRVGRIDGRIMHLWHGDIKDRQYTQRYSILTDHHYDPTTDITSLPGQALQFSSSNASLKQSVENYILSRKDS